MSVWMYSETDGDSGDYAIKLFSTKAKAEAYAKQLNNAYRRITEMKIC